MKLCSVCHRAFADADLRCPDDGATLVPDPLVGTSLGPFAVAGWLAEGGLGILYRGEHTGLHRPVAIKLLKPALMTDEAARRRFFTEAQVVAKLSHPHLIDIFDLGTAPDGRVYYVMELLQGRTLAARMAESPLPFAEVVPIVRDVCEALAVAHAIGLVHRDLKPANLFLVERAGEAPFVKVLDFGIAKVLGGDESGAAQLTRTGHLLGTPQYMAPEQIDGGVVDGRADVYALGVIVYELATGKLPFAAATVGGLLKAHLVEAPPRLAAARLASGVPPALEAVAWKALRKQPDERYDSVRALSDDLGRLARGEPTTADAWWRQQLADGKVTRAQLPAAVAVPAVLRGRRGGAIVAAGALGVALVGGGAWLWRGQPHTPPAPRVAAAQPKRPRSRLPELHSQALGLLTAALKDGDPAIRVQAIAALVNGRDARQRTLIEPLVDDADLSVRAAAATALATLGAHASAPALRRVVGAPPRLDVAVAAALLQLGDDAVVPALRATMVKGDDGTRQLSAALALADQDPAARALLARRLAGAPADDPAATAMRARLAAHDAAARDALAGALHADSPSVQLAAATTLMRLGDERGHARLTELGAAATPLGLQACRALAQLDDQSCFGRFQRVVRDGERPAGERALGAVGLGASGEKSALEDLAQLFDASEPELRVAAAGAVLAIWGADPRALAAQSTDWAASALGDDVWSVREQAATVLADVEPQRALPLLGHALHDRQPEVRRAAASSLGRARSPEAVALLGQALDDTQGEVRVTALHALGRMQEPSAKPLLARHLDRKETMPAERVIAAGQLVKLGDRSRVGELTAALTAADPALRRVAVEEAAADPALGRDAAQAALDDGNFGVRLTAALQLAQQGSSEGVAVLQQALQQRGSDAAVQSVDAWMALGRLGVAPAVQLSPRALLDSGSLQVRLAIVSDGARLAPTQAASLLRHALDDRDWRVRLRALDGIDALGGSIGALRLALFKRALVDADGGVRAKAGLLYAHAAPPDADDDTDEARLAVGADLASSVDLAVVDLAPAADLATRGDLAAAVAELAAPVAAPARAEDAREEARLAMTSAEIALEAGRYDAAINGLQKAHKLDPRLRIYFPLGEAYRKQGDNERDPTRQRAAYAKAIAAYGKANDPRAQSYAAELQERLK